MPGGIRREGRRPRTPPLPPRQLNARWGGRGKGPGREGRTARYAGSGQVSGTNAPHGTRASSILLTSTKVGGGRALLLLPAACPASGGAGVARAGPLGCLASKGPHHGAEVCGMQGGADRAAAVSMRSDECGGKSVWTGAAGGRAAGLGRAWGRRLSGHACKRGWEGRRRAGGGPQAWGRLQGGLGGQRTCRQGGRRRGLLMGGCVSLMRI